MAGSSVGNDKVRIVLADASSFVRLVLSDILSTSREVEVAATAISGSEVLKLLKQHKPDVLVMDLDLPHNSRLFTLQRIAHECPLPVLVLNSKKRDLSETEIRQLSELGVYGFINKPASILKPQLRSIKEELIQKLFQARVFTSHKLRVSQRNLPLLHPIMPLPALEPIMSLNPVGVVAIGASTGGTKYIEKFLQELSPGYKGAVLIAIHLSDTFVRTFVNRLKSITGLKVSLARSGMLIEAGHVIIAPGGRDLYITQAENRPGMAQVMLNEESDSYYDSPSIDLLMTSVAAFYKADTIGIILSGMGRDGTAGLEAISRNGGKTIVQKYHQAGVFGMVKSALKKGVAEYVFTVPEMVAFVEKEASTGTGFWASRKFGGS